MSTVEQAAKSKSNVVRRMYIKRRDNVTGLFEGDWLEITDDVKKFGKVKKSIDATRPFKFKFSNLQFEVSNQNGKYNPHNDENSLWYNYLNQQRTLVRVECAYVNVDSESKPYRIRAEYPETTVWDESLWDEDATIWDSPGSTVFKGIISGDIGLSDKNSVKFNAKPLNSIFEDFSFSNLTGFTSTGITASQYVELLRDQQDGNGAYIFRPFFEDTTTAWNISTTSYVYADLNTSSSKDTIDKTAWQVLEQLAEAENFVPFIDGVGNFNFVSRGAVASAASYEFHGAGSFNTTYGNTIKQISDFGFKISKYYSRVGIKFKEENTTTSYAFKEAAFSVDPANNAWVLGERTLNINNNYFATSTVAQTAADALFADVSALKQELKFDTSLVLGLDIFDRFKVYYDPTEVNVSSLWDINDWGDSIDTDKDLIWDKTDGEQIRLTGEEFKFTSFTLDLDGLKNIFIAREL